MPALADGVQDSVTGIVDCAVTEATVSGFAVLSDCTGAPGAASVVSIAVAMSATVWSVVLAALSVKDRLAWRRPAAWALKATPTVQVRPAASVAGAIGQPCEVKTESFGVSPGG